MSDNQLISFTGIEINGKYYYQPQEKQKIFHDLVINRKENGLREFLYGGSAKGGKSHAVRFLAHSCNMEFAGLRGLLIRSSYPELMRSHLAIDKLKSDFGGLTRSMYKYNSIEHTATYTNGSVLEFGYGKNEEDFSQYLSAEYDYIIIDELTTIPFFLSLLLKSRLLARRSDFIPFFIGVTNPGSIAHAHVKSYFIDKNMATKYPEMINAKTYDPKKIVFVPANVYDNPIAMARDADIVTRLEALSETDRKRFLYGSWEIFIGQFFDKLSRDIHFIDPFAWDKEDNRFCGAMDYGNVTVCLIGFTDKNNKLYYSNEWTVIKKGKTDKARSLYNWITQIGMIEEQFTIYCDSNMFAIQHELPLEKAPVEAFREQFKQTKISFVPVSKKSPDHRKFRVFCNDEMKNGIDWEMSTGGVLIKEPTIYIFKTCKRLFETMQELVTDENNNDDIQQENETEDHHYDCAKYLKISLQKNLSTYKEARKHIQARFAKQRKHII